MFYNTGLETNISHYKQVCDEEIPENESSVEYFTNNVSNESCVVDIYRELPVTYSTIRSARQLLTYVSFRLYILERLDS